MESTLAFLDGNEQLGSHHLERAVVGHLEVIDASHDTRQVVVGAVRRLARLADDGEEWRERFEAYTPISKRSSKIVRE